MQVTRYEVVIDHEHKRGITDVVIFGWDDWGTDQQGRVVGSCEFPPFATKLEVTQWMWGTITRDLERTVVP